MNPNKSLYIGLMTGTSLDSIDAVLVDLSEKHPTILGVLDTQFPECLRQELIGLCQPGDNEIDRLGKADRKLGRKLADAANTLLTQCGYSKDQIAAIGSHGQTIRHRPEGKNGFTLQIGDPNTIAFNTGITTVADFRRRDIAANGQGAPLVPAFHRAVFSSEDCNRAIVNIGGIANVTYITHDGNCLGLDTGPGNILLDSWIQKTLAKKYDDKGQWASSGKIIPSLLAKCLSHPYLKRSIPKSTGREDFNLRWLNSLGDISRYEAVDIQTTLLEFTARSICEAITHLPLFVDEVYICGGGAHNDQLMQRLTALLQPRVVCDTNLLGIPAEWVEAVAFAWLAKQTLLGLTGNLQQVTGASTEVILGGIYAALEHNQ